MESIKFKFAATGKFQNFTRESLKKFILENNQLFFTSVSKNVDFLVNNDINSDSRKNKEAKKLDTPIINEEELMELISHISSNKDDDFYSFENERLMYLGEEYSKIFVVPKKVDGKRVTHIPIDFLKGNKKIRYLFISEGIEVIDDHAFEYCDNLEKIWFPDSLCVIGSFAFSDCINIHEISIKDIKNIKNSAFSMLRKLKKVFIKGNVETLGKNIFNGCISLREIILPDKLNIIPEGFLRNCKNIEMIELPTEVEIIGDCAFNNCFKLKKISNLKNIKEIGIASFRSCSIEEVEFSNSMTMIPEDAFLHSAITEIKFPSELLKISYNAFAMANLKVVILPPKLEIIEENAFLDCDIEFVDFGKLCNPGFEIDSKCFYGNPIEYLYLNDILTFDDYLFEEPIFDNSYYLSSIGTPNSTTVSTYLFSSVQYSWSEPKYADDVILSPISRYEFYEKTNYIEYFSPIKNKTDIEREIIINNIAKGNLRILYKINDSLKQDKDLILKAIRQNGTCFDIAGDNLKDDREVVLSYIFSEEFRPEGFDDISSRLKKDSIITVAKKDKKKLIKEYWDELNQAEKDVIFESIIRNFGATALVHFPKTSKSFSYNSYGLINVGDEVKVAGKINEIGQVKKIGKGVKNHYYMKEISEIITSSNPKLIGKCDIEEQLKKVPTLIFKKEFQKFLF